MTVRVPWRPATAAEAIANGASVKATALAIVATWYVRHGAAGTRDLLDAMLAHVSELERQQNANRGPM